MATNSYLNRDATVSTKVYPFIAGGVSGALSTVMFQPFDLVKTRMQMRVVENSSHRVIKLNTINTFLMVIRNETVFGLWKGTSPSLQRCVPGIGIYFGCMETLKKTIITHPDGPLSPSEAFVISCASRAIAAASLLPFTVVKARYESGLYSYRSMYHALTSIWATERIKGLYRGLTITLARDLPFSSIFYISYSQSTQHLKSTYDQTSLNISAILACGFVSGLIASVCTQPFDVIKTKVQVSKVQDEGIINSVRSVLKNGSGVKDLYSGLTPRVLRRTLMAAFTWVFYEEILKTIRSYL